MLLGFGGEKKDLPLEIHQALIAEILGEGKDVSLKKDSIGPLLQSSEYQPDRPPGGGYSIQLCHEWKTEYVEGCHVFYDPIAEYMEGLGNCNDWSRLCSQD